MVAHQIHHRLEEVVDDVRIVGRQDLTLRSTHVARAPIIKDAGSDSTETAIVQESYLAADDRLLLLNALGGFWGGVG